MLLGLLRRMARWRKMVLGNLAGPAGRHWKTADSITAEQSLGRPRAKLRQRRSARNVSSTSKCSINQPQRKIRASAVPCAPRGPKIAVKKILGCPGTRSSLYDVGLGVAARNLPTVISGPSTMRVSTGSHLGQRKHASTAEHIWTEIRPRCIGASLRPGHAITAWLSEAADTPWSHTQIRPPAETSSRRNRPLHRHSTTGSRRLHEDYPEED